MAIFDENDTNTNNTEVYERTQEMRRLMYPIMALVFTAILLALVFSSRWLRPIILLVLGLIQIVIAACFMFNVPVHYIGVMLIMFGIYHAFVGKDVKSSDRGDGKQRDVYLYGRKFYWVSAFLAVFSFLTMGGLNVLTLTRFPWFETVFEDRNACYSNFGYGYYSDHDRCEKYLNYLQVAAYFLVWLQPLIAVVALSSIGALFVGSYRR
eukprot:TRINITY_DN10614_c0_g1_i1.p1 TRINITY_DN10614_c0_g1~~TRINITY_DN10614_c0_g1_i1.p1  ORF type:complete len:209 (-),score=26.98 TRINITY_DN10614_c0_g1_i1:71-697(-)